MRRAYISIFLTIIFLTGCGTPDQFKSWADLYIKRGDSQQMIRARFAHQTTYRFTEEKQTDGTTKLFLNELGGGCKAVFYFDANQKATRYEFLSKPDLCTYRSPQLM